jgi:hypothetical protein
MVKSPETGPGAQPYWYTHVIGIFHAMVASSYASVEEKSFQHMYFLWVQWFGVEPGQYCHSFQYAHLPKLGFVKSMDDYAFTFLDLALVIQGAHMIPTFSNGCTSALLPSTKSLAQVLNPEDEDNWVNFYINMYISLLNYMVESHLCFLPVSRFVDRDMLMHHFGHSIGHLEYGCMHETELETGDENGEETEQETEYQDKEGDEPMDMDGDKEEAE